MSQTISLDVISAADIARARATRPGAFAAPLRRRLMGWMVGLGLAAYLVYLHWLFDFGRVFADLPKVWGDPAADAELVALRRMGPRRAVPLDGGNVAMAYLGTMMAALVALPLGFLGARNIVPQPIFRFFTRRLFDGFRGLDQLIWALVFVRAVGLGPIAGILAIFVADTGVLAKLYAEAIENTERKQVDGIRSTGGSRIAALRYGVLPQVLPVMISQALYQVESNSREATILGLVGRGRHRAASVGADPDQRLGSGGVCDRADPDHGGR